MILAHTVLVLALLNRCKTIGQLIDVQIAMGRVNGTHGDWGIHVRDGIIHGLPAQLHVILILVYISVLLPLLGRTDTGKFIVVLCGDLDRILPQVLLGWHGLIEGHRALLHSLTLSASSWRLRCALGVLEGTAWQ